MTILGDPPVQSLLLLKPRRGAGSATGSALLVTVLIAPTTQIHSLAVVVVERDELRSPVILRAAASGFARPPGRTARHRQEPAGSWGIGLGMCPNLTEHPRSRHIAL